jgi:hypothetical protein
MHKSNVYVMGWVELGQVGTRNQVSNAKLFESKSNLEPKGIKGAVPKQKLYLKHEGFT